MVVEQAKGADSGLQAKVHQAILSFDPLRMFSHAMSVQVNDGRVQLLGTVRTPMMKRMAEELARKVPGIQGVQNNLLTDTELQLQVAQRLAADPRTRLLTDEVTVRGFLGTIYLQGSVDSAARREIAAKVAGEVPGVRQVINELSVRENTP
ncbi:MAG: BON domain-containing protein [Anaerolineae bacterium]|nr:BON domain-containing protein [Anaerolineae bacterium]